MCQVSYDPPLQSGVEMRKKGARSVFPLFHKWISVTPPPRVRAP